MSLRPAPSICRTSSVSLLHSICENCEALPLRKTTSLSNMSSRILRLLLALAPGASPASYSS